MSFVKVGGITLVYILTLDPSMILYTMANHVKNYDTPEGLKIKYDSFPIRIS